MTSAHTIGKRITAIVMAVAFVGVMATLVPGDTLATGSFTSTKLDLKIDSKAWYNGASVPSATWALKDLVPGVDKFFNFDDIKPGDSGCNVISIHAEKSDAWACIDFKNLSENENGINEPESLVDGDASGELADGLEFFGWVDDGDGTYEPPSEKALFGTSTQAASTVLNNKTYVIGDSKNSNSCKKDSTKYVGMCWCAGNLTVNPTTGKTSCDGSVLGNAAQTDSMSVDVVIRAEPAKDKPGFVCGGNELGGEGCSPGYWKQSQHFGNWPAPYTTTTLFSSVFENAYPGKTLLQVLGQGGGGLNALGRQTVAALLNSASADVDYLYTTLEVIAKFNTAYPSANYDTLKNDLEKQNTISCPLGNDSEGSGNPGGNDTSHNDHDDKKDKGNKGDDDKNKTKWQVDTKKGYSFFGSFFRRT